jgi:peroxiredoxin
MRSVAAAPGFLGVLLFPKLNAPSAPSIEDLMSLMPRQPVPPLVLDTVDSSRFALAEQTPQHFTMLVFYRGLHCPVCRKYMTELDSLVDEFSRLGVMVCAASSDTSERASQTKADWGLKHVTLGYGLSLDEARRWGLYISSSRGKTSLGIEEPPQFSEPGLFLVRPDQTLYWGNVATMPFARPHFNEILSAIDFVLKNNYPARGEA